MGFSPNKIKEDFPIFNNSDLVYLDNASTTQKPQVVLDSIHSMYLSEPDLYLKPSTKIVSITHVSNVLGTINPIKKLSEMAHEMGAVFIVDGAQCAPHQVVNVHESGCDFYTFSGHKMLGPTGIGILWGKMELLESMEPFMGGGEMIETSKSKVGHLSTKSYTRPSTATRFE